MITKVLLDQCDNHLMPFFWVHGESETTIREEMQRVRDCGIKAVCVESRPHPDFLGDRWWHDLDIIMDEARRHNMKVWLLDDAHFPTGLSNYAYRDHYPDKAKLYLAERHVDVLGPQKNGQVLIEPFLGRDGVLLGILACPRPDGDSAAVDLRGSIDLCGCESDGVATFDVPEGLWRVFILFCTREGGGRPHYMNVISRDSVRVLLDTVYEPHYERYRSDFGSTFAGFFSDEPEFGNVPGYDFTETLGIPNRRLPWSLEMEESLKSRWNQRFLNNLPALWYDGGKITPAVRYDFMDAATRLVATCFSEQIGTWCTDHGVQYIGHLIEDDNAHARLGCSLGHYFRALSGQHMAGVDVVLLQIMPGFDQTVHQWIASDRDGEFFHYALAKLSSSHAHLDEKKKGRALCEIFGAYGWAEDISLMKFLVDHMLVRGINTFVPHAFSPKDFPDPDCPPHFYARNKNPQYRYFKRLMPYTNRLAHLLSEGRHLAQAAVIYHAEAEWAGEAMLVQKPIKTLMQHQIDCDILPLDSLPQIRALPEFPGWFSILDETYGALIIPYTQYLQKDVAIELLCLQKQGLNLFFLQDDPDGVIDAKNCSEPVPFDEIRSIPVVDLKDLAVWMQRAGLAPFHLEGPPCRWLRTFAYQKDQLLCLMVVNENPNERIDTLLSLDLTKLSPDFSLFRDCVIMGYDAYENRLYETPAAFIPGASKEGRIDWPLHLEPCQSRFCILMPETTYKSLKNSAASEQIRTERMPDERLYRPIMKSRTQPDEELSGRLDWLDDSIWQLSLTDNEHYPQFKETVKLPSQKWPNLNGPGWYPKFSGYFRYETSFFVPENRPFEVFLLLQMEKDGAEVFLNGISCGLRIASPYLFELGASLKPGQNNLSIDIANTLAYALHDGQSTHMLWKPTGLRRCPLLLAPEQA